jgi:tetratricopeptide (TPR) repeat protein
MIAEEWEFEKLVELLQGFAKDKSTKQNVQDVLGIPAEEFDKRFLEYVGKRYGNVAENIEDWRKSLKSALEAAREKKWDAVKEPARKAQELYPEYVDSGNPYRLLAEAFIEEGDKKEAASQLLMYRDRGGRDPETLHKLVDLLEETSQRVESIKTLEELIYIWPADTELHAPLGEWLLAAGRLDEALREFNAHLSLQPLDKAGAHYNLAKTYHKMEDRDLTRRHLLMALEAAPSYRPAQKLLLEITQ